MSNKRILFFHHYNDYSGSTRVLANILSDIYASNPDLCVLTDNSKKGCLSEISNLRIINIPILRINGKAIPFISQLLWLFYGFIVTSIVGRRYDQFYINTIIPVYAAVCGRLYKKEIIYHIHEKYTNKSVKSRLAEFVFNITYSERRYVSKYVCNQYKNDNNCPSYVVYNKLPKSFVSKVKVKPLNEHKRNSLLMIGYLSKEKGAYMIRDLAMARPEYRFIAVFNAEISKIESFFDGKTIPDNLILVPKQANIHPFLFEADVMLNLTQSKFVIETFGMTIIEGMAYGLPSVVPNVGGPSEIVVDGYNGKCVDTNDMNCILKGIDYCLDKDNYTVLYQGAINYRQFFFIR